LESPEDFESSEDLYEAVGGMIVEAAGEEGEEGEEVVRWICEQLFSLMQGDTQTGEADHKLLDAPVNLAQRVRGTAGGNVDAMTSIWMKTPDYRNSVDQKKLDKVDAKLKQKLEKRAQKETSSGSGTRDSPVLSGPTTSQSANKQLDRAEASGGLTYDLKIENIDIAYGHKTLLTGADLNLTFGRRYGLVGRNGSGKTTLLRSIASRELRFPSHLSVLHVEQEVEGGEGSALQSVLECDREREELMRLVKSAGAASSSSEKSLHELYARLEEIEADKAPAKAAAILAGLGFTSEMQASPTKQFSGGWRMRLALARALFTKPDLLLLDEPTNMLDMRAVIWLENYLLTWSSTILVVSHDRSFLSSICTDIIHMHSQGLDPYRGNYETFVQTKTEKLKSQQREYEAQMQYRQHLQDFVDRWRYNAKRASQAQSRLKILEKLPDLKPVVTEPDVILRFPDTDKLSPPILQLSEITFGYGKHEVFKNMNISADMESRIALVGENGAGKTTLVKLLTGELSPQDGYRQAHRNLRIAFFHQHHVEQLVMNVSALELMQQKFPGRKDEEYRHLLGMFGVSSDLALRPIASLSGGQKSRLAFAIMAVPRPNFLIFDEPTNHLDVESVDALGKALNKFPGGVILVSHDEHLIGMSCNAVWLCKDKLVYRLEGGLEQYKKAIQSELQSS
jgi:ATP-binding cassette subfamily F protein 3